MTNPIAHHLNNPSPFPPPATSNQSKMRLPYAPSSAPPETSSAETSAIYTRIAERRAPYPLLPLDLALLHSPPIADGWNTFLGAVRQKTILPAGLLELAICRVAVLNKAAFQFKVHCPLAFNAGVSVGVLRAVRDLGRDVDWVLMGEMPAREKLVLEYTDAMTKDVSVTQEVFDAVTREFTDREVVELTAAIGAYNCVSRFLVALNVGEMNDVPVEEWKIEPVV